ncbi:MAG: HAD family hydrolase [Mycoplasmoidaceae bacterium]
MKYHWAAIDLDHTLLNYNGKISLKSLVSIKKYQDLGGKIFICTGRWLVSALSFNDTIEIYSGKKNDFLISLNGALIYDLNLKKIVFSNCISDEIFKKLIDIQNRINISIWIYSIEGVNNKKIYAKKLPLRPLVAKFNSGKIIKFNNEKYDFKNDTLKILFLSFNKKKIKKVLQTLDKEFSGEIDYVHTSKRSIEITNKDCNKGEAIKFITKKYNIKKEEIVAFGDSNNDVPMFEQVGFKIGINPSSKKLIELADEVTTKGNSFAYSMDNFIINKK